MLIKTTIPRDVQRDNRKNTARPHRESKFLPFSSRSLPLLQVKLNSLKPFLKPVFKTRFWLGFFHGRFRGKKPSLVQEADAAPPQNLTVALTPSGAPLRPRRSLRDPSRSLCHPSGRRRGPRKIPTSPRAAEGKEIQAIQDKAWFATLIPTAGYKCRQRH